MSDSEIQLLSGRDDESPAAKKSKVEREQTLEEREIEHWISELKGLLKRESLYFDGITNFLPMIPHAQTSLKLLERDEALNSISSSWEVRKEAYCDGIASKSELKLPVCIGTPGVGKSRVLHEYRRIFHELGIDESVGVLVVYDNGRSPKPQEKDLSISSCLAWRLLHRLFVEPLNIEGMEFDKWLECFLESTQLQKITLPMALRLINSVLRANGLLLDKPLSLFLGIDDYQSAPCQMHLLTACLLDTCSTLFKFGIHVYPMMAGTKLAHIEPSNSTCEKIRIPLLSTKAGFELAHIVFMEGSSNVTFNDRLSLWNQLPRAVIHFAKEVKKTFERDQQLMDKELQEIEEFMVEDYAKLWRSQTTESLLTLISFAIANVVVAESDRPSITIIHVVNNVEVQQSDLTWRQLSDRGFLQLTSVPGGLVVDIPLIVMKIASCRHLALPSTHPARCLQQCLTTLFALISTTKSLLRLEPWKKWECFGAIVHAAKLNAWCLIGYETIQLSDFLCGMSMDTSLADLHILIKPAIVFSTSVSLSPNLPANRIIQIYNNLRHVDLFDKETYSICLNASGGGAGDIYFRLDGFYTKAPTSIISLLFVDQRKRECIHVTTDYLNTLCERIDAITPKQFCNQPVLTVKLIFSCFATLGKRHVQLPQNTALYTHSTREMYMGALRNHPSACRVFGRCNLNYQK